MGEVVSMISPQVVEAAWDAYCLLMRGILENPELTINRAYMEETARAEQRWKHAFLSSEPV